MSAVANKVDNLRKRAITSAGFGHIEPHPPPRTSPAYDLNLATLASRVLYRSGPDPSGSGGPLLILCAAAFPDTRYVDYNKLLPYVLSELPGDEELLGGIGYSVVFFAGAAGEKPGGETYGPPAWSWSLQVYNLLSRAVRKNIRRLWIVHERAWVRILFEAAQTVVSPKFKKKVVHVHSLSELATHIPLQALNIPPQVYLHDRKINPTITVPNPPPPMFGVQPFPPGEIEPMLPLVLIESSRYIKSAHLRTEGLFRISCSMQLLEIVREAYDRGQYMRSFDYGPHVAAGLIKLYYRSLPEPLMPKRYYPELPEICKTPEGMKVLLTAHEREGGLPSTSRILLTRHLLPLLAAVAAHSGVNKMTPENLAICVSPSLVRSEDPLVDITISRGSVCQLIKYGIEHIDE
ncbi:Rho GTPase activation protein, partial [Tirmania nivea]